MKIIKRVLEALSADDQKKLLDLEGRVLDIKKRIIDASTEEKISLKKDLEGLKLDMTKIKERGSEEWIR